MSSVAKHPRVVGVSLQFQQRLRELSPNLYKRLSKDAEVRRMFYLFVKRRATIDAFRQREALYDDALTAATRNARHRQWHESNRVTPAADKRREEGAKTLALLRAEIAKLKPGLRVKDAAAKLAVKTGFKDSYLKRVLADEEYSSRRKVSRVPAAL